MSEVFHRLELLKDGFQSHSTEEKGLSSNSNYKFGTKQRDLAPRGSNSSLWAYFHIGQAWKVHESTVSRVVRKVENALIRVGVFQLPGKKQLLDPKSLTNLVVIDATETPIERPKKGQRRFYSGMKLRHTFKTQLVIDPKTKAVICTTFAAGKEHDASSIQAEQSQTQKRNGMSGR